jgi:hypothetical protein
MEHLQLPTFTILASLRRDVFTPHSDGHQIDAGEEGPDCGIIPELTSLLATLCDMEAAP